MPFEHVVTPDVPSHLLPAAHVEHASRVVDVPPVVCDPAPQVRQSSAWPALENLLSAPQVVQDDAPAAEKVPCGHVEMLCVPSQLLPAAQIVHVSRLLEELPVVKEPAPHVRQWLACPACEYLLSRPQSVHESAPAAENVPLAHVVTAWVPSHLLPAVHLEHPVRVLLSPPEVNDPAPHVEHLAAPAMLNLLSEPHLVHAFCPSAE